MFNMLIKWLRRRIARFAPAHSETYSEPGVVFEVKMNAPARDPQEPQGLSETFSEPGVVFEVDCRAGKEHTGTAGK